MCGVAGNCILCIVGRMFLRSGNFIVRTEHCRRTRVDCAGLSIFRAQKTALHRSRCDFLCRCRMFRIISSEYAAEYSACTPYFFAVPRRTGSDFRSARRTTYKMTAGAGMLPSGAFRILLKKFFSNMRKTNSYDIMKKSHKMRDCSQMTSAFSLIVI